MRDAAMTPEEIADAGGPSYPNVRPYTHITAATVVWNDAERLEPLLSHLRSHFSVLAVVVQDSPDETLAVARRHADVVRMDSHRGYGDASFGPILLPEVRSEWTFKVDADEWPDEELLGSLSSATWLASQSLETADG